MPGSFASAADSCISATESRYSRGMTSCIVGMACSAKESALGGEPDCRNAIEQREQETGGGIRAGACADLQLRRDGGRKVRSGAASPIARHRSERRSENASAQASSRCCRLTEVVALPSGAMPAQMSCRNSRCGGVPARSASPASQPMMKSSPAGVRPGPSPIELRNLAQGAGAIACMRAMRQRGEYRRNA